jgi:hypothetical protein
VARGLELDLLWHVESIFVYQLLKIGIQTGFLVIATIFRCQMYRDMHLRVYYLTRRLGEVVGALDPSTLLRQLLVLQLYSSTLLLRTGSHN